MKKKATYPVVLYQLQKGDEGYDNGYRFRIDQLDGDSMFATTRERADELANQHAMTYITEEVMFKLRDNKR